MCPPPAPLFLRALPPLPLPFSCSLSPSSSPSERFLPLPALLIVYIYTHTSAFCGIHSRERGDAYRSLLSVCLCSAPLLCVYNLGIVRICTRVRAFIAERAFRGCARSSRTWLNLKRLLCGFNMISCSRMSRGGGLCITRACKKPRGVFKAAK